MTFLSYRDGVVACVKELHKMAKGVPQGIEAILIGAANKIETTLLDTGLVPLGHAMRDKICSCFYCVGKDRKFGEHPTCESYKHHCDSCHNSSPRACTLIECWEVK